MAISRSWKTVAASAPLAPAREGVAEMLGRAGAARGDHRHRRPPRSTSRGVGEVVAGAHAVAAHAVEHDLAGAALAPPRAPSRACARPVSRRRLGRAGILLDAIVAVAPRSCRRRARRTGCRSRGPARRSAPGRSSAGELIETLSAPASRQARGLVAAADAAGDREGDVDHRARPAAPSRGRGCGPRRWR